MQVAIDAPGAVVVVLGAPDFRARLERHVEGVLGWQSVSSRSPDVVSSGLRPSMALVDLTVDVPDVPLGLPVVMLVAPDDDPGCVARAVLGVKPWRVVDWPADRSALAELADSVPSPIPGSVRSSLHVAGASGGVGTTTVALALAGLMAWSGLPVLAVLTGDAPCGEVPEIDDASLDGPGTWVAAVPVVGVGNLRAVRRRPSTMGAEIAEAERRITVPAGVRAVVDLGVGPGTADVLVLRRDRAGRDAALRSPAGALVLLDDGPLTEAQVLADVGRRTVAVVPYSARVARAGVARRIPTDLPASWLEPLRGLVMAVDGSSTVDPARWRSPQ